MNGKAKKIRIDIEGASEHANYQPSLRESLLDIGHKIQSILILIVVGGPLLAGIYYYVAHKITQQPFKKSLGEYSQCFWRKDYEGLKDSHAYVRGKIVTLRICDYREADPHNSTISSLRDDDKYSKKGKLDELQTRLPGHITAKIPQEVGTIIFVNHDYEKVGRYEKSDGFAGRDAIAHLIELYIYDYKLKKPLGVASFCAMPPEETSGTGIAEPPYGEAVNYVSNLPVLEEGR